MPLQRVAEAIEAIKKGEMIIMMDDEDRENEGDLVYAATFSTPQKVNFMVSEAKGLVCVCMTQEQSHRLDLAPMVQKNNSQHETAFTISIDAAECTTGISAYERDLTIRKIADSTSRGEDFVRPGHIFPLVAKEGGVLVRLGHTEGSIDICKLAGVAPVSVICEILKKDGHMARRDDLLLFAKEHGLKIVYISDLVEYRMQHECLIRLQDEEMTRLLEYEAKRYRFIDHRGEMHTVYRFGQESANPLVRYHIIDQDLRLLEDSKRYSTLMESIARIHAEGGILIFMQSQNRAAPQMKDFGIGAQILHFLGVKDFRLLTLHEHREYGGLGGFGLNVTEKVTLDL